MPHASSPMGEGFSTSVWDRCELGILRNLNTYWFLADLVPRLEDSKCWPHATSKLADWQFTCLRKRGPKKDVGPDLNLGYRYYRVWHGHMLAFKAVWTRCTSLKIYYIRSKKSPPTSSTEAPHKFHPSICRQLHQTYEYWKSPVIYLMVKHGLHYFVIYIYTSLV